MAALLEIPDKGTIPPGGWSHFEERTGVPFPTEPGHKISDFDQLVRLVEEHRKGTGGDLDIGWVARLIDDMCRQHPDWNCAYPAKYSDRRITKQDLMNFVHTAKQHVESGGAFVHQALAERRASICARCPMNVQVTGCFGCGSVLQIAFDLIAGKSTKLDDKLHSCNWCGCLLKLKVHIPREVMVHDGLDPEAIPEWCWIREEDEAVAAKSAATVPEDAAFAG